MGVSIQTPIGTMMTLSPVHSKKRGLWSLTNHKATIDASGEVIAWVRNNSDTQVLITDKTQIAAVHVSRVRAAKSARKKLDKVQKLIRKGNALSSETANDDHIMEKWMSQIQLKPKSNNHGVAIEKARKALYSLQEKWLAKELNPRTVSIHDPDDKKGGRYDVIRINGVRTKIKGQQKEIITNVAFMNPTFKTLTWDFTIPKEVSSKQNLTRTDHWRV